MTAFADHLKRYDSDLSRLADVMHRHLGADVRLVAEMEQSDYLTGGKRLRAIVALLAARLCNAPPASGDIVAIAIEFIHTATLLHDDVVDEAPMRRHLPAAARVYGNAAAVLAGDFLYSRASQLLSGLNNLALLARVADATNKLAQGELLQLINRGKPDLDEQTYYAIITRKTANLFSAAAAAAALLTDQDDTALSTYGHNFGVAFQLVDDCLDYEGSADALGKKVGADFNEGKMTLPVILMLSRIDGKLRDALITQWRAGDDDFSRTVALLHDTNAIADVRRTAAERATAAAAALANHPNSDAKAALLTLTQTLATRDR